MTTCRTYTIEKAPTPGFLLTADQYEFVGSGPFNTTLHISYLAGANTVVRIVNSDTNSGDSCLPTDITLDPSGYKDVVYTITNTHIIYVVKKSGSDSHDCCTDFNISTCQYSNYIKFTVIPPTLGSIDIYPISSSINIGDAVQLSATCKDDGDNQITCPALTWSSTNNLVATVDSSGLVAGLSTGSTNITASSSGITSNISSITITPQAPILTTIEVLPTSASVSIGGTQQFTAVCKDESDNTMTCPTLTWGTTDNGIGSISSTGLFTGIGTGTVTVTATVGQIVGSSIVTVAQCAPNWQCEQPLNGYETDLNNCSSPNRRVSQACMPIVQAGFNEKERLLAVGLLFGLLDQAMKKYREFQQEKLKWKRVE